MADVRALLRQQRAARQIHHPYAAYSDAGKLLCTLCREQIRAESHWDAHLQSDAHKRLLLSTATPSAAEPVPSQKRKLDAADDNEGVELDDEAAARRKRSRSDAMMVTNGSSASPGLIRRKSATPSQGVEMQIPSRPTTPALHGPAAAATSASTTSLPSRQASNLATPSSNDDQRRRQQQQQPSSNIDQQQPTSNTPPPPTTQPVDDAEWAAFEADIAAASAPYADDAVISRPAMTAEESAAAAAAAQAENQDEDAGRRAKVDVDIEDEREEATRALEEEFEEMQELEARVRRLKDKMEALRKRGESQTQSSTPRKPAIGLHGEGKENVQRAVEHEEEVDDDDDDEDDWDGFRFRTR